MARVAGYVFMVFAGAGAGGFVGLLMSAPFWGNDGWGPTMSDLVLVLPASGALIGSISFPWLWYRLGKNAATRRTAIDTTNINT